MWPGFVAAIGLGLLSSLHCAGMCGPLALSLPLGNLSRGRRLGALVSYHSGRLLTYALLGAIIGIFGRRIYLAGLQQVFSVAIGGGMLVWIVYRHGGWFSAGRKGSGGRRGVSAGVASIYRLINRVWRSSFKGRFILLGMANGLLPCSMVYMALAGALTAADLPEAIGRMVFFGLGTWPMMLAVSFYARMAGIPVRYRLTRLIPYFMAALAFLLVLRGLDLGIPFVSPRLPSVPGGAVSCH